MKHQVIKALQQEKEPVALFNTLLGALVSTGGNPNLIRSYNLRGYSSALLETLKYDVMKHLDLSEADLRKPIVEEKIQEIEKIEKTEKEAFSNILRELNAEEKEAYRLHLHFPFLYAEGCPAELQALAFQANASFYKVRDNHSELFKLMQNNSENLEEIYNLSSELLTHSEINADIFKELEYYKDNGEVLGEHPLFSELKMKREVDALNGEGLAKAKNNIKAQITKAKNALSSAKDEAAERKYAEKIQFLSVKQAYINEKLKSLGGE